MHIQTSDGERLELGIGTYTCNWGTHLCGLYATEAERDAIIFGYLHCGGIATDHQIFIHSEQSREQFYSTLTAHCPACAALPGSGHEIDVKAARDLYFPEGTFDPWTMDRAVNGYYAFTQQSGPANLRAVAEMAWAVEMIPGTEHLFAYESRLNYFVKNRRVISLCLYNINKISGQTLMKVLQTHPYTITGNTINQNPYYVHPDRWLAEHAPQFL